MVVLLDFAWVLTYFKDRDSTSRTAGVKIWASFLII